MVAGDAPTTVVQPGARPCWWANSQIAEAGRKMNDSRNPKRNLSAPIPRGEGGKFLPGYAPKSPGRPKGSRNRFGEAFIGALCEDFAEHGSSTIARVREDDPAAYLRLCVAIMPKEVEITSPLSELTDDELMDAIELIRAALRDAAENDVAQGRVS